MGRKRPRRQGPQATNGHTQASEEEAGQVIRGILSGGLWGVVTSAVVLAVASLVGEQPPGSRPPLAPVVQAPELAPGSGAIIGQTDPALPGGQTDQGGAPQPSQTPAVGTPQAGLGLPEADTSLPVSPQADETRPGIAQPTELTAAPDIATASDSPFQAGTPGQALTAPQSEAGLAVPIDPTTAPPSSDVPTAPSAVAQDVAPQVSDLTDGTPLPGGVPGAGLAAPDVGGSRDIAQDPAAQPDVDTSLAGLPSAGAIGTAPQVGDTPETGGFGAQAPAMTAPDIDAALPVTPVLEPEPVPEPVPEPSPEPRIALQGDAATMPGNDAGVRIIRPGSEAASTTEAAPGAAENADLAQPAPALERFAAPYDNTEAKPILSVILIDGGQLGDAAVPAVASIPFPVTIGIDATAPGANVLMQAYRAAGIEVIALASLPQGAQPSDVEITLEAAFAAVPEAIGLLDVGDGGLQSDREATDQVMARLAAEGRGLITQSQGLNMALRAAEAAEVPAWIIYRDLDSESQDARVIRRFLDQAAFRARQQSGVVLVGRVRPDTVSALILWGTANRAGQVTLAPVSAVLTGE